MRLHTSLTQAELFTAAAQTHAPIAFERLDQSGSQTHARAFEVRLSGTGGKSNTGMYGAGDYSGATWDEWGAFMGAVYALDPSARWGGSAKKPVYADAEDFHFQTGGRFRAGVLPVDTHPRHRWVTTSEGSTCGKEGCTAYRPSWRALAAYRAQRAA